MKGSVSSFPGCSEMDSNLSESESSGHGSNCRRAVGKGMLFCSLVGAKGRDPLSSGCLGRDWGSSSAFGTQ